MQRPEVELARRLIKRRGLTPPIDILHLLEQYADVKFVEIPFDIDGLCLNLKSVGTRPEVLVQRLSSPSRQRFTMAHELGHVLIPWHVGTIIDEISLHHSTIGEYWAFESEANQFASELLIPSDWVVEVVSRNPTPADALREITHTAEVSRQAAAIKLISCLQPHYIMAYSENNIVKWSNRSNGTLVNILPQNLDLGATDIFPFPFDHSRWESNGTSYEFWKFGNVDKIDTNGIRDDWRLIFNNITSAIGMSEVDLAGFKRSFGGIIGNANGSVKLDRSIESISTAIVQRLHARAGQKSEFRNLVNHPDFHELCHSIAKEHCKSKTPS